MSQPSRPWDEQQVRKWLERRIEISKLDQAEADRRGYEAQDDYDKAAAEEWVCHALKRADAISDQAAFAAHLKALIGQDDYQATGTHDDTRFARHVRSHLRKLARMTKANEGFDKLLRYH